MKNLKTYLLLSLLLVGFAEARIWVSSEGSKTEAEYVSQGPEKVNLRSLSDRRTFEVSIAALSERDQYYLKNLKSNTHELSGLRGVSTPEKHHFAMLHELALEGNPDVLSVLMILRNKLYEGINYHKDRERVLKNGEIMRAFFTPLGQAAGGGNEKAFEVLIDASAYRLLRGFVADACGVGAALGSAKCLQVLLNHKEYDIYLSSAVFAMKQCAEQNNPEVIDFLINVLSKREAKALWHTASKGLVTSAENGNEAARKALAKYKLYQIEEHNRSRSKTK